MSPYFVPGKKGWRLCASSANAASGFGSLTNSLASTDVAAVFAAYRKYRRDLLEAGMEVYE